MQVLAAAFISVLLASGASLVQARAPVEAPNLEQAGAESAPAAEANEVSSDDSDQA